MKQVLIYYFCDVCGRREMSNSDKPRDWQIIKYKQSWQSGGHSGDHSMDFLACEACLKEDKKKLFGKLLEFFKKHNK